MCSDGFRVPSPLRLCRSCRRCFFFSWENTPLDCWSMHFVDVVHFSDFSVPWLNFENVVPLLNDYASKTRIEILCKKTCSTAPHLFSKSHLLSNSCEYRTFARMST